MTPAPFISYARHDFPFVRDLVRSLREEGIDAWVDIADISAGESWNNSIESALMRCTHCLVILSPYSLRSSEVMREIDFASRQGKLIVPVLLQAVELPSFLQVLQWIDFRVDYEKALSILLARLRGDPLQTPRNVDAPPRPSRFLGFEGVVGSACPRPVKVVTTLLALSAVLGAGPCIITLPSQVTEDNIVCSVVVGSMGFYLFYAFRTAMRRVTLFESALLPIGMAVSPLLGLIIDHPPMLLVLALPLNIGALIVILVSKTYHRWMPAYPYRQRGRKGSIR